MGGDEGGREMPIYEGGQCSFAVLQLWDLYPAGAFSHNFHFLLFSGEGGGAEELEIRWLL